MDASKSPRQLMQELIMLHQRVAELEATVLHQQVEETPQRHAAHFRQMFQWSRQGILVHRYYKPLFANQAFATLYGYAVPDDILGLETVLPLIAPPACAQLSTYRAARRHVKAIPIPYEVQGLRPDGTLCWIEVRASRVLWDGAPATLITCIDITACKQAEPVTGSLGTTDHTRAVQGLQQAYTTLADRIQDRPAALAAAHEALRHEMALRQRAEGECRRLEREAQCAHYFTLLGRLAASVLHDIRHPLSSIFLHVGLLESELQRPLPDSATQIAEALAPIKTNLTHVDNLVQNYLSLARTHTMQRDVQDLGAAVQTWAAEFQKLIASHGVRVRLDGLAGLGLVPFHANTLRRALLSLVQNALDAMPHGGTLILQGQGTAPQVQLQVRDTGGGIPAERLSRIFEPLYTTKLGGTGLGLYIVQEIVAAHEGQVTVYSLEGQGTTCTITLPRAAAEASARPTALSS